MARKNLIWADAKTLTKDLNGKIYLVTGANSGVGLETTRQLVKQGAHVVMACRRVSAAKEQANSFSGLKGSYEAMVLDLADLQSVRDFVAEFKKKYSRLDGLVCNAGGVFLGNAQYTKDGLEMTMAVNYFGHFLLTESLLDMLKNSAPARMIILSSVVHAGSPKNRPDVHLDDIHCHLRKYNGLALYSEAKVAANLYAMELAERLKSSSKGSKGSKGEGVFTASLHPGWARSNFGKGQGFLIDSLLKLTKPLTYRMSDSSWESAQTSLHCLLSDEALQYPGAYFSQSSVLYRDAECKNGGWPMVSPNPNAKDMDKAKKLVEKSYEIVGLKK